MITIALSVVIIAVLFLLYTLFLVGSTCYFAIKAPSGYKRDYQLRVLRAQLDIVLLAAVLLGVLLMIALFLP